MIVLSTFVWADQKSPTTPPKAAVTGEVMEVINVANFTYLRLKTGNGDIWAAVVQTPIQQGATVTIENAIVMSNFESKALKRTFPSIIFGSLSGAAATPSAAMQASPAMASSASSAPSASGSKLMGMSSSLMPKKMETTGDVHVKKASGKDAHTVADVITKSTDLKDKTVVVRGKVVKYNAGIMGKNWIHLRDGSGSVEKDTNDILVTSTSPANVGDIITAKGVVHLDKDFGAGYSYKVLIEDATLQ
jgi:hypothetical protein